MLDNAQTTAAIRADIDALRERFSMRSLCYQCCNPDNILVALAEQDIISSSQAPAFWPSCHARAPAPLAPIHRT